ncbi:MAG: DUF4345 family protein [Myxococcales bacterium]|nr:DUF4345 family protein [Myxococcales bacterium]MDH3483187.1 DUF4345 family protein [Myxococcales bacterium]
MPERYPGFVLWGCALVFVVISVVFTLVPSAMFADIGLVVAGGSPMTELRAVYGGVHLAIGVFLVVCASRGAAARELGLLLSFLAFSALAGYRAIGMAVDGQQVALMSTLLVMESAGVVFALSGLLVSPRSSES